jgi:hypothetical protein
MERPSLGPALTDLADYASARMFNAYARKANSARHRGYVPYQGANNLQISMVNGTSTLSTVTPIDTYSMRFDWQHFHWRPPGSRHPRTAGRERQGGKAGASVTLERA